MALALEHEDRKKYFAKMREEIEGHVRNVFDLEPEALVNPQHPHLSSAVAWLNRFFDNLELYSAHIQHCPAIRTIDAVGTLAKPPIGDHTDPVPVYDAVASIKGESA